MDPKHLDYLDTVARQYAEGERDAYRELSTGERLYVALAVNCSNALFANGYTVAQALARLDPGWADALADRWKWATWRDFAAMAATGAAKRKANDVKSGE